MLPGAVAHFAKPPQFMLDEFLQLSHLENMVTGHGTPSKAQQQNQRQHLLKQLQLVGRAVCSCSGLVSMAMDASSSLSWLQGKTRTPKRRWWQ